MNNGLTNEKELRDYINSNNWSTYNKNIQDLLKFSFGNNINSTLPFYAEKCKGQIKPDLSVTHNNEKKYISVKKGSGNSVHQERIDVFFPFIRDLYDEDTLNKLKQFHYGDGTTDDTGKARFSASECQRIYKTEIASLNTKFNEWKYLKQFLDRFLFKGNIGTIDADIVYHGTISNGIWASRQELYEYFKTHTFNSNALHFASLTYQVWGRNNDFKAIHPDRRYIMQVKWSGILNDLSSIREDRNNE